MGINGLWSAISSAAEECPLGEFLTAEALRNHDWSRGYVLGIDASIWFYNANQQYLHANSWRERNPEISMVFRRLMRLHALPVTVLLILDGGGRPSCKRGKRVNGHSHWMTEDIIQIALALGFYIYIAPGEAEAELAVLCQRHIIHAILTDDSDTLVFGGVTIIRNPDWKSANDTVKIFTANRVRESIGVDHGGLVLFALLNGGDYNEVGILGFGPIVAIALARCGFGNSLLHAAQEFDRDHLESFLVHWRCDIRQELRLNSQGHLPHCYPALANTITDSFPDINALNLYANPLTSWSSSPPLRDWPVLRLGCPDVHRLATLCERYFRWGNIKALPAKFQELVWPGLCLRKMWQVCEGEKYNPLDDSSPKPLTIHSATTSHPLVGALPSFNVEFSISRSLPLAISGICDQEPCLNPLALTAPSESQTKEAPPQVTICVDLPAVLIERVAPDLIARFMSGSTTLHHMAPSSSSVPRAKIGISPSTSISVSHHRDIPASPSLSTTTHVASSPPLLSPSADIVTNSQQPFKRHIGSIPSFPPKRRRRWSDSEMANKEGELTNL
ncbi:hypothetical protein JAAARDRAFT_579502 [Jaapia argillacea MUCL 33604]|uniref:XPG-I domain-containing protein n=1 Tax=Jaapia argillacea MUCL 33604 TaxID=933084 RepID=A0A067Q2N1_9AGAM|nr:hypothetical protein JAAARDRAFT_579502 [Jaapia argillacea MUCL 33604]